MDYITLQRSAGWSSYKEYSRWDEVIAKLPLEVVELDDCRDWDKSFALVKNARVHLGIDSVFQHVAAAYKVPAVVLFGSTTPVGSGHVTAVNLHQPTCGKACFIEDRYSNGHRCNDSCPYPIKCIDAIEPQTIVDAVSKFFLPCPVCGSTGKPQAVLQYDSPYYNCQGCGLWRQIKDLPKTFESSAEAPGDQMSEGDKQVNKILAGVIQRFVKVDGTHLSIGSKYPMLSHWLQAEHRRKCIAIDGIPEVLKFGAELGVEAYQCDAEQALPKPPYASVDMIHVLEHIYEPVTMLNKIADAMMPGGILFIRSPNHDAPGIERDMTKPHYEIHPHVYNETSFRALISQTPGFRLTLYEVLLPGQFDAVLEKTV
jgi:SAM-dependent methyltransferase